MDQKYLKECLHYNPHTGIFTWLERPESHFATLNACRVFNSRFSGIQAGVISKAGYVQISINQKIHKAHRLAWLYVYGKFPNITDHINQCKSDNRIVNLRDVDRSTNGRNMVEDKRNKSGATGVCWHKRHLKWIASIKHEGKLIHLGYFDDIDDAAKARKDAEVLYGYHENHGRSKLLVGL